MRPLFYHETFFYQGTRGQPSGATVPPGIDCRDMHGMLSAGILIGVFGAVAVAGLYMALRLFRAGGRQARVTAATANQEEP